MSELEQALHQELTRLHSAVSYVEEANQHAAAALAAAEAMKAENERLLPQLQALHQRLHQLEAAPPPVAKQPATALAAGAAGLLLLSCWALLRRGRG